LVFLIFGIGKFRGDEWADTMRSMEFFARLPWKVEVSIILAGISETIVGLGLLSGRFVRIFAGLAALQLIAILILLYFSGIYEVRDIGLLFMALALIFDKKAR